MIENNSLWHLQTTPLKILALTGFNVQTFKKLTFLFKSFSFQPLQNIFYTPILSMQTKNTLVSVSEFVPKVIYLN